MQSTHVTQAQPAPQQLAPARPTSRLRRGAKVVGWRGAFVVELAVLLALWEVAITGFELADPAFFPSPTAIFSALIDMARTGVLWEDVSYSGLNFVIGYLLAATIGTALGFVLGAFRRFRTVALPPFWVAYAIPIVSIQPLLLIWMGFGVGPKILIVFLMAFFPIVFTILEGVQGIDRSLVQAARVFGVDGLRLQYKVLLPAAVPYILVGLRLGIARALIGVVIGEFIGGTRGLGHRMQMAGENFDTARGLAITLVLIVVGNIVMFLLQLAKQRLAPWERGRG